MTPVDKAQQDRFLREIIPAASGVCPQYGEDPKDCVLQAAIVSSCGRFHIAYNWWSLRGEGDAGFYSLIRPVRTYGTEGGGWSQQEERIAKFRSPESAVRAWCMARRR